MIRNPGSTQIKGVCLCEHLAPDSGRTICDPSSLEIDFIVASTLNMALPAVFVTGGIGGIGAAICKQLVLDHGCRVFLGSRSIERGHNAIKDMGLGDKEGNISVVECDVQSDDSVKEAAAKVGQFCRICITFI